MEKKTSFMIAVGILACGAVVGFLLCLSLRPAFSSPGQEPAAGRYQIAGCPGHAFVLDTATGQVWEQFEPESQGSGSAGFLEPKLKGKP